MASRQFIFCDLCNVMGIRLIEERRNRFRAGGRRRVDGRAWIEGSRTEAKLKGWCVDDNDHDVCAQCHEKGLDETHFHYIKSKPVSSNLLQNH